MLTQASHHHEGAGNDSAGSAPATNAAPRAGQAHLHDNVLTPPTAQAAMPPTLR